MKRDVIDIENINTQMDKVWTTEINCLNSQFTNHKWILEMNSN